MFGCQTAWIYDWEFGELYNGQTEIYFSQIDDGVAPVVNFVRVENADTVLEALRERGATIDEEIASRP